MSLLSDAEQKLVLNRTMLAVKSYHAGDHSGHDWHHVERVFNTATAIAAEEHAVLFVVQMAALLHDVDDAKLYKGEPRVPAYLSQFPDVPLDWILSAINEVSFSKNKGNEPSSIESAVVRDADRLDAIGAIGVARVFAYGGSIGRPIYDPRDLMEVVAANKNSTPHAPSSGIYHFYQKLLLIKDMMATDAGKRMAEKRHEFLELFLDRFFEEWNGGPATLLPLIEGKLTESRDDAEPLRV